MSNSINPDETAHYEPSHLDLGCWQKTILSTMAVKELRQDRVFRRKRLNTGANFVYIYSEIWDTGILKFNKFSM